MIEISTTNAAQTFAVFPAQHPNWPVDQELVAYQHIRVETGSVHEAVLLVGLSAPFLVELHIYLPLKGEIKDLLHILQASVARDDGLYLGTALHLHLLLSEIGDLKHRCLQLLEPVLPAGHSHVLHLKVCFLPDDLVILL